MASPDWGQHGIAVFVGRVLFDKINIAKFYHWGLIFGSYCDPSDGDYMPGTIDPFEFIAVNYSHDGLDIQKGLSFK